MFANALLLLTAVGALPAAAPADPSLDLPDAVRAALERTVDFTPNFDQPGYWATLAHVAAVGTPLPSDGIVLDDWAALVERPSDFRGRPLHVAGLVGFNKGPYIHQSRPELGRVWQLELRRPGAPATITLICTRDVGEIPLGASVEAVGYFVLTREWKPGQYAAVLVARAPTRIATIAPPIHTQRWPWVAGGVAVGLLLAVVLLRGAARRSRRTDPHRLSASRPAPIDLSDDLAAWSAEPGPADDAESNDRH